MFFSPHLPEGFRTYWWNVESLMTQEHIQSMLRSIIATKIVIYNKFNPHSSWEKILGEFYNSCNAPSQEEYSKVCSGIKVEVGRLISNHSFIPVDEHGIPDPGQAIWPFKRDAAQNAQFIKSSIRWPEEYTMPYDMYMGYLAAGYCMHAMDFISEGTSEYSDKKARDARAFKADDMEKSATQWLRLADEADGNCQFIIDHVTAFEMEGSEYEKQRAFKPCLKFVFEKYPILFWVVIQDGVGNQRDKQRYGYTMGSMGGDVLRQEVNLNWSKGRYDSDKSMYWDVLEKPVKSRIGVHPSLAFMMAPSSGAYIGEAQISRNVTVLGGG